MTTIQHKTVAAMLAFAVLTTIGVGESHAQRGKSQRSSFKIGNNNNNNNNNGPKFNLGNFGNSAQTIKGQSGKTFTPLNPSKLTTPKLNKPQGLINSISRNGGTTILKPKGTLPSTITGSNSSQSGRLFGKSGNAIPNLLNKGPFKGGNNSAKNSKNGSNVLSLIKHNQKLGKVCVSHQHWCHAKPAKCHWWYNWCQPIAYCEPHHYVHCRWNYVTCDYIVGGNVLAADARWYLGMKGLLLPGQGLGVEEVTPGSPAAAVGLAPGMVITRCNEIDLVDEAALGLAIEQSGGVLRMELLLSADGPPATCVVVMQRAAAVSF